MGLYILRLAEDGPAQLDGRIHVSASLRIEMFFYGSAPAIAVAGGILCPGLLIRPSVRPIHVNAISPEFFDGSSSKLRERTRMNLLGFGGQRSKSL